MTPPDTGRRKAEDVAEAILKVVSIYMPIAISEAGETKALEKITQALLAFAAEAGAEGFKTIVDIVKNEIRKQDECGLADGNSIIEQIKALAAKGGR